ncbi:hypothetical protein HK104_008814 [Borealophlyctis nickersoniae]|nr:hypothetical protein HK104_008814 [Borealophlyctis nickersoniae]
MTPVIVNKDVATVISSDEKSAEVSPVIPSPADRRPSLSPASRSDAGEEPSTSLQNIVALCQMATKVSYDICKNNEHVAKLLLLRNVYRLGEIVTGIIDFGNSSIPCFQVSMFLESTEQLEPSFSNNKTKQQLQRMTRRVIAERHQYTLNTKRMAVSLSIPVGSTPEFRTTAVSLQYNLRLEFITSASHATVATHSALHVPYAGDPSFEHSVAVPSVEVEAFDCVIPLKVHSARTGRGGRSGIGSGKGFVFEVA